MRSELYFIHRWHERNTTRNERAVVRIRRIMRTLADRERCEQPRVRLILAGRPVPGEGNDLSDFHGGHVLPCLSIGRRGVFLPLPSRRRARAGGQT